VRRSADFRQVGRKTAVAKTSFSISGGRHAARRRDSIRLFADVVVRRIAMHGKVMDHAVYDEEATKDAEARIDGLATSVIITFAPAHARW
jgi:hypothetical protein